MQLSHFSEVHVHSFLHVASSEICCINRNALSEKDLPSNKAFFTGEDCSLGGCPEVSGYSQKL